MDRADRIGAWISGLAHAGLLGWAVVGGFTFRPELSDAIQMSPASTMSEAEFQALAAAAAGAGPLAETAVTTPAQPRAPADQDISGAPDAMSPPTPEQLAALLASPDDRSEAAPDLSQIAQNARPGRVTTTTSQPRQPDQGSETTSLPQDSANPARADRPDLTQVTPPRSALAPTHSARPLSRPAGLADAIRARQAAAAAEAANAAAAEAEAEAAERAAAERRQAAADQARQEERAAAAQREKDAAAQHEADQRAAEASEKKAAQDQAKAKAEADAEAERRAAAERRAEATRAAEAAAKAEADAKAKAEARAEAEAREAARAEEERKAAERREAEARAKAEAEKAASEAKARAEAEEKRAAAKAEEQRAAEKAASEQKGAGGSGGGGAATSGPPLSQGEKDGFRIAVEACWNRGALSTEASRTTVSVRFSMGQNGMPDQGSLRMVGHDGPSDAVANQAYEAARRAILMCAARNGGYDLPAEKYNRWKDVIIDFRPSGSAAIR